MRRDELYRNLKCDYTEECREVMLRPKDVTISVVSLLRAIIKNFICNEKTAENEERRQLFNKTPLGMSKA